MPVRRRQRARTVLALCLPLAGCVPRAAIPPARPIAPAPAPPTPARATLRQAMMSVHAGARAQVGLPALAWDEALASDAQRWADALARAHAFRHAAQEAEGENLWMGTRGAFSYADMAGYWVGERRRLAAPRRGAVGWHDVGHYTQIVWRDTRRLGCAVASNARDDVLVCRYWPAGNVEGEPAY